MVVHCNKIDHNFDIGNATLIKREDNPQRQKCLENDLIASSAMVNLCPGSYNISPFMVDFVLSQCGTVKDKGDGEKKE